VSFFKNWQASNDALNGFTFPATGNPSYALKLVLVVDLASNCRNGQICRALDSKSVASNVAGSGGGSLQQHKRVEVSTASAAPTKPALRPCGGPTQHGPGGQLRSSQSINPAGWGWVDPKAAQSLLIAKTMELTCKLSVSHNLDLTCGCPAQRW
jgi:hypothetical protein